MHIHFHSDHLGSAGWITGAGGIPIQHLQYLPFGEPFVDQRMTNYSERFTFTGKERDEETGYYYFDARYLWSTIGFLSVDPLSDKYPSLSGYAYCAWNPLRFSDPTGMTIEPAGEAEAKAYQEYRSLIFSNNKKYGHIQKELLRLEGSEEVFKIRMGDNTTRESGGGSFAYNKETGEFDVNIGSGGDFNTMEKLSHELKHADQYMNKQLGFDLSTSAKIGYDRNDEIEAYMRQGEIGKTLTNDQINTHSEIKKLQLMGINNTIQNINYEGSTHKTRMDINQKWYNGYGKPRFLYHGWKNDLKNK